MIVELEKNLEEKLKEIYPAEEAEANLGRYNLIYEKFNSLFGEREVRFFTAPGRTELGGNHTDHNKGKVLAASVQLDTVAAVSSNGKSEVKILSDECNETPFEIDLTSLGKSDAEEGTLKALVRGIAKYFVEHGFEIGGFNAVISSNIPFGAGLSSSASVEVLIGEIFNLFFNKGEISKKEIAFAGQFAENHYFGKPCGLMDQLACAYGGIIKIDFENEPKVEQIDFNFEKTGYALLVVDTGKSHSDLTRDYAAITEEMKNVSKFFGKNYLREIDMEEFYSAIPELRKKVSERAILRAIHFYGENERVEKQVSALKGNNFEEFLRRVNESGNSSAKNLQNLFSTGKPGEQSIPLALALSEKYLENKNGVARVHGGGFAGTIQVLLPQEYVSKYKQYMENIFGENAVLELKIRETGVTQIL